MQKKNSLHRPSFSAQHNAAHLIIHAIMLCRQQSNAYIMWGGQRMFKKDTSIYRAVCLNVCMWVCFLLLDEIIQHNVQVDKVAPKLDMTHRLFLVGQHVRSVFLGCLLQVCALCRHINYLGYISQWAEGEHDSGIWILLQQSTRSTVLHVDMKMLFMHMPEYNIFTFTLHSNNFPLFTSF